MKGKALLAGMFVCALPFWAEAGGLQFDGPIVLQGNGLVVAPVPRQPAAKQPQGDVLEFVDGSMLHGQLQQMDVERGVAWENPDAKNPIYFQPGHIDFIRFARADTVNLAPTCRLQFANGDDLYGSITSLNSDRLGLSTWFGGTMSIPRAAIRAITFLSKNYAILYEGPYDASGWVFGIANMPQSWAYHDGWFTSQGTGTLGRDLSLTNSSTIEFDLGWSGPLELEVQLYTDALERMENNNGSCVLQFMPNQVLLRHSGIMGAQRNFASATLPDTGGKNRIHVTIQCNQDEGTLSLFINDALAKTWKEDGGFHSGGSGILFQQAGFTGGTVKLGNLRISQWEGSYDPDTTLSTTNADSIHFVNHDRAAGKITAIDDGKVTLEFGGTALKIPLQRVTQINFATTNSLAESSGPWEVRAHFPGGGSLSFQLEKWGDKIISGKSTIFGLLAFQTGAIREMEFNLNRPKDDGATVAIKDFDDLDE
ncbi:MAG TPA: hypothetical protein VMR33_10180 [Candidatus Baltobacteraceae bacterium]|jgi:hypothetical protein|nr:hypothetical protein [Candidatus Baltobacteraceae bacterium]